MISATPNQVVARPVRTTAQAGATLLGEAARLIEQRRWRNALTVLESAERLRANDPAIDELRLIAAAHARRPRLMAATLARIEQRPCQSPAALHARAVAALSRHHYHEADALARQAIEADPSLSAGWTDLATAFAGLGWFEQSEACLSSATAAGTVTPAQYWRLGRAVNRWAMTQSYALAATAVAILLVGILALAVGLSTPVLLREVRVAGLPEPFKTAAEEHWRTAHAIKLVFAAGVLISVLGFVIGLRLTSGA